MAVLLSVVCADCASGGNEEPSPTANHQAQPFGPGCSSIPRSGTGSFAEMSKDLVTDASAHLPMLSQWVHAVDEADMHRTLKEAQHITVFAPDNAAFAKVPKSQLAQLLENKAELRKTLLYHVVGHRITPDALSNSAFTTLSNGALLTSGSGQSFKVDGTANIVCGNIQTVNANLYIIDSVLSPQP
jgi:uncharacterized surface protein with fasciclin (FAS1) repeats